MSDQAAFVLTRPIRSAILLEGGDHYPLIARKCSARAAVNYADGILWSSVSEVELLVSQRGPCRLRESRILPWVARWCLFFVFSLVSSLGAASGVRPIDVEAEELGFHYQSSCTISEIAGRASSRRMLLPEDHFCLTATSHSANSRFVVTYAPCSRNCIRGHRLPNGLLAPFLI